MSMQVADLLLRWHFDFSGVDSSVSTGHCGPETCRQRCCWRRAWNIENALLVPRHNNWSLAQPWECLHCVATSLCTEGLRGTEGTWEGWHWHPFVQMSFSLSVPGCNVSNLILANCVKGSLDSLMRVRGWCLGARGQASIPRYCKCCMCLADNPVVSVLAPCCRNRSWWLWSCVTEEECLRNVAITPTSEKCSHKDSHLGHLAPKTWLPSLQV